MSLVSDQSELSIVTIDQSEASAYLMMDMERGEAANLVPAA